jgi:type II secretory pathway pseudopilin PulG
VVKRLLRRLRAEDGFGLIELSMAIVMLNVGILAIVAAFQSGAVALRRANLVANATAIADTQMEAFRRMRNCEIALDDAQMPSATSAYALDTAAYAPAGSYFSTGTAAGSQRWVTDYSTGSSYMSTWETAFSPVYHTTHTASPVSCSNASVVDPDANVVGPDNNTYTVHTYIYLVQVNGQGWQKQVTIVVRQPTNLSHSLVRESSNFDPFDSP